MVSPAAENRRRRLDRRRCPRRHRGAPARAATHLGVHPPWHRLEQGRAPTRNPIRRYLEGRLRADGGWPASCRGRAPGGREGGPHAPRRTACGNREAPGGRRRVRPYDARCLPRTTHHALATAGARPGSAGHGRRRGAARRRAGARERPSRGRALPRRSCGARDPSARLRVGRGAPPLRVRGLHDRAVARHRMGFRARARALRLPAEHGDDDRARDRDRLLAPRRQPLPRRAPRRAGTMSTQSA